MSSTATPTQAPTELNMGDVLARAWKLFTDKPGEHIVCGLLILALSSLTAGLCFGPLLVGYIRLIDRQERGEALEVNQLFDGFQLFAPALVTTLVIGVGAFIGALMLALPAIFVLLIWSFAMWFVALKQQSATAALGASWSLFRSHLSPVLLVFLVFVVLNFAGCAVLFGVLFTFPFSVIVQTVAFRDLAS